ncbi:MAG: response regulator [Moorea sp. SIO2B7]|nr:response regulator [Moorena sp. SIO2B7]
MTQVSIPSEEMSKNLHPIELLKKLSGAHADGCLQVSYGSVSYFIHFNQGKLIYATNSVDPFERLERHLRRLSYEVTSLTNEVRTQVRLNFDTDSDNPSNYKCDYQAICWLVEQQYLDPIDAAKLLEQVTKEVFENYLLLTHIEQHDLIKAAEKMTIFWRSDLKAFVVKCQRRLHDWQSLCPPMYSSYQRPYFFSNSYAKRAISPEQQKQLGGILKGFSFRQLAVLLNQDELALAKKLHPLIINGAILLREPQPPFDKLPKISSEFLTSISNNVPTEVQTPQSLAEIANSKIEQKNYKIACVDDSPTILNEINRFLEDDHFSIFTIDDSAKALMQIIRIKPDLILLDVGMPTIDGYQLCSMIRKHSLFKATPIVMVTGNKGLVDRAKARLSGATDYMTKPFTQAELQGMVFRYLT